jgi:hypothetical protein
MSKTNLEQILYPKGSSAASPNIMPSVLDSDDNPIGYFDAKRKTSEATVVDIGDSPNSNSGDALRTAFIKINNFIEANYWWSEHLNHKLNDLDSDISAVQTRLTNGGL